MIVRTVLGDIDPSSLGVTYAHEHLIIDSPTVAREWPEIHLHSSFDATREVGHMKAAGVTGLIDAMPTGSGRDASRLVAIARETDLNIVAVTGMHTLKYYEGVDWVGDDPEELAERFVGEIETGMDETSARAGLMKVAMWGETPTDHERSVFQAAGIVHAKTGVPVITHCEGGIGALTQIDLLETEGIAPDRVLLSHTDKIPDRTYHRAILDTGAMVEYDQSLRQHLIGSTETAQLVAEMVNDGYGDQILLGTDGARRSLWRSLGGSPGLDWLKKDFPLLLAGVGMDEADIESIFVFNPARFLAFDPR